MERLRIQIRPLTDFASPLKGGMLFGQLAWAIREASGESRLESLLSGYRDGRPFVVVSDAFPKGYVPMPALPLSWWGGEVDAARRKNLKALKWLPLEALSRPLSDWESAALGSSDLVEHGEGELEDLRHHNTISRATNTTGEGGFAPFSVPVKSFATGASFDLHVEVDETRFSAKELMERLSDVGGFGFGRDAATGLGKFEISGFERIPAPAPARCWLSLAAMASNPGVFEAERCFYRPTTYFGRHGNIRALGGTPFKKPLVLADTGAFLTTHEPAVLGFAGCGISGYSAYADTVHQGYAPLLPLTGIADSDL